MSSDPNKKSARTFQCRDILWDAFQQMAQELECSVDYLVKGQLHHPHGDHCDDHGSVQPA